MAFHAMSSALDKLAQKAQFLLDHTQPGAPNPKSMSKSAAKESTEPAAAVVAVNISREPAAAAPETKGGKKGERRGKKPKKGKKTKKELAIGLAAAHRATDAERQKARLNELVHQAQLRSLQAQVNELKALSRTGRRRRRKKSKKAISRSKSMPASTKGLAVKSRLTKPKTSKKKVISKVKSSRRPPQTAPSASKASPPKTVSSASKASPPKTKSKASPPKTTPRTAARTVTKKAKKKGGKKKLRKAGTMPRSTFSSRPRASLSAVFSLDEDDGLRLERVTRARSIPPSAPADTPAYQPTNKVTVIGVEETAFRYPEQLIALRAMGFVNANYVKYLLADCQGNVSRVVSYLFENADEARRAREGADSTEEEKVPPPPAGPAPPMSPDADAEAEKKFEEDLRAALAASMAEVRVSAEPETPDFEEKETITAMNQGKEENDAADAARDVQGKEEKDAADAARDVQGKEEKEDADAKQKGNDAKDDAVATQQGKEDVAGLEDTENKGDNSLFEMIGTGAPAVPSPHSASDMIE